MFLKDLFKKRRRCNHDLKDENTTLSLKRVVSDSLDADLPDSYDKELFQSKTNLLMSVFIDKAVQGMRVVA